VFVDEGHYEPAVEWGQAVKQLQKPTVLLTATPYRNDLKLFQVKNDDVHHYTHEAAETRKIIRKVELRPIGCEEPSDQQIDSWCDIFAKFWKGREKRTLHKNPRAIISCAKMATVSRVTKSLRQHRINAIGIHERFGREKEPWLVKHTPDPKKEKCDVWVHQNKLTEGLDDHRFCVLAALNLIRNDRKLVQQIGRVLRQGPAKTGHALVLYSDSLNLKRSWDNYREFESDANLVSPERYREVLTAFLRQQPSSEYFGARFRRRFEAKSPNLMSEVLLRASAVVRRVRQSFKLEEFTDFTTDFLLLEDRILLGPEEDVINGPNDSKLWVYALFGNSPVLIEHSQYEIKLGALAAVKHGDLLFIVDTEGIYPSDYLSEHTMRLSPDELRRIFSKKTVPKEVSLTNPWPVGPMVRRSTIYSDNLANTPAQLTDAVLVCAGVRATTHPERTDSYSRRHYVGFQRGRISEQIRSDVREQFTLLEFAEWSKGLAEFIQSPKRTPPEFFRRYLSPIPTPTLVNPKYLVFNFFEGEVELQNAEGEPVELIESIIEVEQVDAQDEKKLRFQCKLRYRRVDDIDSNETNTVEFTLSYEVGSARFRLAGEELNTEVFVKDENTGELEGFTTYLNSNDEAFTLVLAGSDTYYTAQAFYRVDYTYAEDRLAALLTSINVLRDTESEKGERGKGKTKWDRASVFSVIADLSETGLIRKEFGKPEFLICDDLQKEVADFVCANFKEHKIALIHAKYGKKRIVSASALQEVVGQTMKNLNVLSRGESRPAHLDRWHRTAKWAGTKIRRWLYGSEALPTRDQLWVKIREEIIDHPNCVKEVWVVVGQTLRKDALLEQLSDASKRDEVTGHVVQLLSTLNAACTQIGVHLRIFCD
jgi:hypothetical protein